MKLPFLAQLKPQRSRQYTDMVHRLAPLEIHLSPLGRTLTSCDRVTLGGQDYLRCDLETPLEPSLLAELDLLAFCGAFFHLYDEIGGIPGPFFKPLERTFVPSFPSELITTRRYQGKTNELLTHFMCNIARFSSSYADQPWQNLRIF